MLSHVIIDDTTQESAAHSRFATILRLVADRSDDAVLYLYRDWAALNSLGISTAAFEPDRPRVVYLSRNEYLEKENQWTSDKGQVPARVPTDEMVYSLSPAVCCGVLEQQGLNATTAMLTLAAAGVDIALPNVSFASLDPESLGRIRETLEEERQDYLHAVANTANESFERIQSGSFKDICDWARNESRLKILPSARELTRRIQKLDRTLLRHVGAQFWSNSVPAIGRALVDSGAKAAGVALGEELVRLFGSTLSRRIEERRLPLANYVIKLSEQLPAD